MAVGCLRPCRGKALNQHWGSSSIYALVGALVHTPDIHSHLHWTWTVAFHGGFDEDVQNSDKPGGHLELAGNTLAGIFEMVPYMLSTDAGKRRDWLAVTVYEELILGVLPGQRRDAEAMLQGAIL